LVTKIPRSVAAGMSIVSRPIPYRAMIRHPLIDVITSAGIGA
jgi:hypothetical protein